MANVENAAILNFKSKQSRGKSVWSELADGFGTVPGTLILRFRASDLCLWRRQEIGRAPPAEAKNAGAVCNIFAYRFRRKAW